MPEFNYNLKVSKMSIAKRKPVFGIGINDSDYITKQKISNHIYRVALEQTNDLLYGALLRESYNLTGGNYA